MGNFVGPTLGGVLVDNYGFQTAGMVLFCACNFNAIIDILQLIYSLLHAEKVFPVNQGKRGSGNRPGEEILIL